MTWRLALDHLRSRKRRQTREDALMAATPQTGDFEVDTAARERSAGCGAPLMTCPNACAS